MRIVHNTGKVQKEEKLVNLSSVIYAKMDA